MFEYTLIMAICSASAPANYAHEMAYYWPTQRHIRIHTERDGQRDRQGDIQRETVVQLDTRIGIQIGFAWANQHAKWPSKATFIWP